MFSQVEDLLPVISFGSKKDSETREEARRVRRPHDGARLYRAAGAAAGGVVHAGQAGRVSRRTRRQIDCMHIIDRRLNPGGKSLANRQRFLRRAKAVVQQAVRDSTRRSASITDIDEGGEVCDPDRTASSEPRFQHAPAGRHARPRAARQQGVPGGRHDPAAARRRRRRRLARAARTARGRTTSASSCRRRNSSTCSSRISSCPTSPSSSWPSVESFRPAPRRLFGRAARPPTCRLTRTMRNSLSRRIALRRAEARRDRRRSKPRSRPASRQAAMPTRLRALRAELGRCSQRARSRIPFIDPIDVRYRRFEPVPEAGRPGGHVLPDGRLGLDDRAHEGPGQALLHAALHLPEAALPARRDRLHPPHRTRPQRSTRRPSSTSPRPAAPSCRRALEEMRRIVAERFPPRGLEHLRGPGLRRRQRARATTSKTARAAASMRILPVCQYFAYLEVGRGGEHGIAGFNRRAADLWRTYEGCGRPGARFAMRKVRHRARDLPGLPRPVRAQATAGRPRRPDADDA